MNTLITGATGQVGRSLVATAPADRTIVATSRDDCDFAEPESLVAILRSCDPAVVINTAAYTAVDRAEDEPEIAMRINAEAVATLAAWCAAEGRRLIQLSTDFVFDGAAAEPWPVDATPNPLGSYGLSKLGGEQVVLESGADAHIVRTSWVYSEFGHNFVRTILRLASERDELTVVADQVGAPTYARNLAAFIWKICADPPAQRILHFSDSGAISWYDFAVAILADAQELGLLDHMPTVRPVTTAEYAARAPRPAYSVLDLSGTESLGVQCAPWRTALRDMLARLRDRPGGTD